MSKTYSNTDSTNNKTTVAMGSPPEQSPVTNTTAASLWSSPEQVPAMKAIKQGHSFLFCLCDMRRAVFMLDTIGMLIGIMSLIASIVMKVCGKDEDIYLFVGEHYYNFGVLLSTQILLILGHLSGIYGAATFTIGPIVVAIVMDIMYSILFGMNTDWFGLASYIFLLYPHVVLCYELAKGIMTKENYHIQERHCCCSV